MSPVRNHLESPPKVEVSLSIPKVDACVIEFVSLPTASYRHCKPKRSLDGFVHRQLAWGKSFCFVGGQNEKRFAKRKTKKRGRKGKKKQPLYSGRSTHFSG